MATMSYTEWTRTSAAYQAYVAASQRCANAFQEDTMTDQRYSIVEQTTERPATAYAKASTSTKYVVAKAGKEPRSYDPAYVEREHAELHARIANAIPDDYRISRGHYRQRSMSQGHYWLIERNDQRDPRKCSHRLSESNGLDKVAETAIRLANEHAAGAGARIAQAEADEIIREASKARRAELIAKKGELATPRQVDYIMSLLAKREYTGDGGGFFSGPTNRAQVEEMSKAEASVYIDSLTENY